jgi:hypothetical protein
MKKLLLTAILVPAIMLFTTSAFAREYLLPESISDVIEKGTKETDITGSIGMGWRHENREVEDDEGDDTGFAGWAFVDLSIETGSMWGFQIGAGVLAVQRLWKNGFYDNDDPDDELFDADVWVGNHDAYWTEGYLKYTIPNLKTSFLLGRANSKKFGKPKSGDGDFWQGFGITVKDIPRLEIQASVVNQWTNNASWSWDFDGIQDEWAHLDDEDGYAGLYGEEAHNVAYTLMVDAEVVKDLLWISPFMQHQGDVGTKFGTNVKLEHKFDPVTVGVKGIFAYICEHTPDDYWPDDEDQQQYLVNPYVKAKVGGFKFELGCGYYGISDDIPLFNSLAEGGDDFEDIFIWDEFDPMQNDLAKYGEQQNNDTWFVHAGAEYGPFRLKAIYGWCDNAVIEDGWSYDGEASELDLYLTIAITKNLETQLVYVNLEDDYKADGDKSMDYFAGYFRYKF